MFTLANIFVGLIGLMHFYFLILEMFLWTKPKGLKAFGMTQSQAEATKVLAANQGLYNGFLAAGLLWGLFHPSMLMGLQIKIFFLSCVLVAGVYGGYSVGKKILFIQALPAAVALLLLLISGFVF